MHFAQRLILGLLWGLAAATPVAAHPLAPTEQAFLDYLDAVGAVELHRIRARSTASSDGTSPAGQRLRDERGRHSTPASPVVANARLDAADVRALAAMRRSLDSLDAEEPTAVGASRLCGRAAPRPRLRHAARGAGELLRRARQPAALRRPQHRSRHGPAAAARRRGARAAQGALRGVHPALGRAQRPQRGRQPLSPHDRAGRQRRRAAWLRDRCRGARDRGRARRRRTLAGAGAGSLARREPVAADRAVGLPVRQQRGQPAARGEDSGRNPWCR